MEPKFGQPIHPDRPDHLADPYAHLPREDLLAHWEAWERPAAYDPQTARQIDPATTHPYKVAYMALLALIDQDEAAMAPYWLAAGAERFAFAHGEEPYPPTACLAELDPEAKIIDSVQVGTFEDASIFSLPPTSEESRVTQPHWWAQANVLFTRECPIEPVPGVTVRVDVSWDHKQEQYVARGVSATDLMVLP